MSAIILRVWCGCGRVRVRVSPNPKVRVTLTLPLTLTLTHSPNPNPQPSHNPNLSPNPNPNSTSQVAAGCHERGAVIDKLRQRYSEFFGCLKEVLSRLQRSYSAAHWDVEALSGELKTLSEERNLLSRNLQQAKSEVRAPRRGTLTPPLCSSHCTVCVCTRSACVDTTYRRASASPGSRSGAAPLSLDLTTLRHFPVLLSPRSHSRSPGFATQPQPQPSSQWEELNPVR